MLETERKEIDWAKMLANFDTVMELCHLVVSIRVEARKNRIIAYYGLWSDFNA